MWTLPSDVLKKFAVGKPVVVERRSPDLLAPRSWKLSQEVLPIASLDGAFEVADR